MTDKHQYPWLGNATVIHLLNSDFLSSLYTILYLLLHYIYLQRYKSTQGMTAVPINTQYQRHFTICLIFTILCHFIHPAFVFSYSGTLLLLSPQSPFSSSSPDPIIPTPFFIHLYY